MDFGWQLLISDGEPQARAELRRHGFVEDRRGDARKIYDKISDQKDEINKEIQRLGELVAGKK